MGCELAVKKESQSGFVTEKSIFSHDNSTTVVWMSKFLPNDARKKRYKASRCWWLEWHSSLPNQASSVGGEKRSSTRDRAIMVPQSVKPTKTAVLKCTLRLLMLCNANKNSFSTVAAYFYSSITVFTIVHYITATQYLLPFFKLFSKMNYEN